VHGEADDVVPPGIARRYHERAVQAGDPCELVMLPGMGHMEHLEPQSGAWEAVVRWLEARR
jgi:pimeloyl-ACP methyl ester carboxylesterase